MFTEKYFTAKDGTRICYVDEGQGRPVIFIHGFTANKEAWVDTYCQSVVDAGFRFIAMDLRASEKTAISNTRPVTLTLVADDVHAIIEHLGLSDVTLVGHSQGGKDIMAYEMKYGNEYLHSICMLDTCPCTHQEDGFGYATRFDTYTLEQCQSDIASFSEDPIIFFTKLYSDGNPDLTVEQARAIAENALSGQHVPETVDLYVSSNSLDLRPGVDAINVPTAYLYAEKGTLIHPEIYTWFSEHIKSDYYPTPFDTSAHGFPFSPEFIPAVTETILDFLRK